MSSAKEIKKEEEKTEYDDELQVTLVTTPNATPSPPSASPSISPKPILKASSPPSIASLSEAFGEVVAKRPGVIKKIRADADKLFSDEATWDKAWGKFAEVYAYILEHDAVRSDENLINAEKNLLDAEAYILSRGANHAILRAIGEHRCKRFTDELFIYRISKTTNVAVAELDATARFFRSLLVASGEDLDSDDSKSASLDSKDEDEIIAIIDMLEQRTTLMLNGVFKNVVAGWWADSYAEARNYFAIAYKQVAASEHRDPLLLARIEGLLKMADVEAKQEAEAKKKLAEIRQEVAAKKDATADVKAKKKAVTFSVAEPQVVEIDDTANVAKQKH